MRTDCSSLYGRQSDGLTSKRGCYVHSPTLSPNLPQFRPLILFSIRKAWFTIGCKACGATLRPKRRGRCEASRGKSQGTELVSILVDLLRPQRANLRLLCIFHADKMVVKFGPQRVAVVLVTKCEPGVTH